MTWPWWLQLAVGLGLPACALIGALSLARVSGSQRR